MMDDYYQILRVPQGAAPQVIKAAYNRLALKYHPDHNPQDAAAEKTMKRLNEAWYVLGDPATRRAYDRKRQEAAIQQAEREREAAAKREETARREKAQAEERARKAEEARLAAIAKAKADRKAAEEKARQDAIAAGERAKREAEAAAQRGRPGIHARRTHNHSQIRKPHWSPHWFDIVVLLIATGVGLVAFASTARGSDMVRNGSTDAWYTEMVVIFAGGLVFATYAEGFGLYDGRYWTVSVPLSLCLAATFGLGALLVSDIRNASPETVVPFAIPLLADLVFLLEQRGRSKRHRSLR